MEDSLSAIGIVTETSKGMARIVFKRSKACGDCHACASLGDGSSVIEIENTLDAKEGDRVMIELHPGGVFKASLILYGVPLAALLLGVFIGSHVSDTAAALVGLGAAGASLAGIKLFDKQFGKKTCFKPEMKSIISGEASA